MSDQSMTLDQFPPIKVLSKLQRRVLGALIEKGITTPEYYPLTLKALTTACNQKNNRAPLSDYSEDDVERGVNQLRELGLAAVVHTESGRSERYRHYVRKRFPFTEPQLAIVTELWLRGRQSMGDLRVRASRMHAIDSLEQLRDEVKALIASGFARTNGPLEARGIDVDHNFYKPEENKGFASTDFVSSDGARPSADDSGVFRRNAEVVVELFSEKPKPQESSATIDRMQRLQSEVDRLSAANLDLSARLSSTQQTLAELADRFESLRRELGAS